MKSSAVPAACLDVDIQLSGGVPESLSSAGKEELLAESPHSVPHHPLGIKPSGNQYTASLNSKSFVGPFQLFPDEVLAILLEYLDSGTLRLLGLTCKFLYAFCRSDDLWKTLFIE